MLYMFREGIEERLEKFVKKGGILVMTYWSGVVDETDLTFLGGTPHGLTDVLGLRFEEIDALPDEEENHISPVSDNKLGITGTYSVSKLCELIKLKGAKTLMTYDEDWYSGYPALCENEYGKGKAYYVCADAEEDFYRELLPLICKRHRIKGLIPQVPYDVDVASRESETARYIFIQNFGQKEEKVALPDGEVLYGEADGKLPPVSTTIIKVLK